MHDVTSEHWHEPEGRKNAGYGAWKRPNTPYDDFMEAQGIPIFRGIGVKRVQDMPLKPWARMGGNGTFIQLYGTEGKWGCYVVEVPGARRAQRPSATCTRRSWWSSKAAAPPRSGPTARRSRTSSSGSRARCSRSRSTRWHRIVNAASSPALILVATTAPNVMNLFRETDWIFNCPVAFPERFDGSADFFKPKDDIKPDPLRGLAMRKSNLIPDIMNGQALSR